MNGDEDFRVIVEASPVALLISRISDGLIVFANQEMADLVGLSIEELIGQKTPDFYYSSSERQRILEILSKEGKLDNYEILLKKADGALFWVSVSVRKITFNIEYTLLSAFWDITERKQVEKSLMENQEQLRSLTSQLVLIEEKERRDIARELHNRIGQNLALTKIRLELLRKWASSTAFVTPLNEILESINQALEDTHALIFEISPPILYELGLNPAVEWLAEQLQKDHDIMITLEDDGMPKPITNDVRIFLFQAIRELLVNVIKHAQANKVNISLLKDNDQIRITIEDDGVGFKISTDSSGDYKTKGYGLFSIQERMRHLGGNLGIESDSGNGTRITLIAPLKSDEQGTMVEEI